MENNQNKPRFLREKDVGNMIGTFFPLELELIQGGEVADFQDLRGHDKSTMIFFASESCGSCNYDSIKRFVNTYEMFNYIMLLDASKHVMVSIIEEYNFDFKVIQSDLRDASRLFGFDAVPFVVGLNKLGQICSAGNFHNDFALLTGLLSPFLKVYYPNLMLEGKI